MYYAVTFLYSCALAGSEERMHDAWQSWGGRARFAPTSSEGAVATRPSWTMRRPSTKTMLVLLALAATAVRVAAKDVTPVIYVESGNSGHGITRVRLENCVKMLAGELGIEKDSLPTVMVIHVGKREAERAGMKGVAVKLRTNRLADSVQDMYYEVWLVGEPSTMEYVYVLHYLLEQHFSLHMDAAARMRTVTRVARWLDGTVSAK